MVKIIMHGCNGHMGQVITGLVKEDANAEIIAGIDMNDNGQTIIRYSKAWQNAMFRQT